MASITTDLQQHLQKNPKLQKVYLNDKGQWQFFNHPAYQHQILTRDEALAMHIEPAAPSAQKKGPAK